MKILLTLSLIAISFWTQPALSQTYESADIEWLSLGQNDFSEGYKTMYRLKLEVPKGVHDIYDIKKGLQVMRFKLTWLPPFTSQEEVQSHFKNLLGPGFDSVEDLKFNQTILNRLYKSLPEAKRHDVWFFEFSPEAGTSLYIEEEKIHTLIGSEANNAIHQAWLHESPVTTSKLMKRLLKAQH